MQDDVASRHTAPSRGIPQVVRRKARIDSPILQLHGGAKAFVHRVDQAAPVLDGAVRPITVAEGVGHAPDTALGVAAHAVLAKQAGTVPDPAVEGNVSRPVDQPGVDLSQVIIDRLPQGLSWVFVGSRLQQPQFQLVGRLVGPYP